MASLRQFVGFMLGHEHYGVDIMLVQEIIRMVEITPVPRAPSFVEGVINIRGRVLPIVDLRRKLNMSPAQVTVDSRIIIVNIHERMIGLIVDSIDEVVRIDNDSIDIAPGTSKAIADYIEGVAKIGKGNTGKVDSGKDAQKEGNEEGRGMVIILDISQIFTLQERIALEKLR